MFMKHLQLLHSLKIYSLQEAKFSEYLLLLNIPLLILHLTSELTIINLQNYSQWCDTTWLTQPDGLEKKFFFISLIGITNTCLSRNNLFSPKNSNHNVF